MGLTVIFRAVASHAWHRSFKADYTLYLPSYAGLSPLLYQADSSRWPNAGLMLGQRRRRWHNIKPALGQRLLFTGMCCCVFTSSPIQGFRQVNPLTAKLFNLNFHPLTWSCVSLTKSTTSSEWKLFRFDKMEVNCFQILLIDVTFYL